MVWQGFRDGSFESDVPLEALAATFGATFTIVSQVNPHVAPFYAHLQGRAGRPSGGREYTGGWRGGFLLGALEVHILFLTSYFLLLTSHFAHRGFLSDTSHQWTLCLCQAPHIKPPVPSHPPVA